MVGNNNRLSYAHVVMTTGNSNRDNNHNTGNDHDTGTDSNNTENLGEISVESNLHPLYLHNMDHPGLVLISKKLIGTENFGPWKRSISIALSAKNKLGIVNGMVVKPDEDSPLRSQWDRVNDMVISWILNTVSDEISSGMDFVTSAKEMWEELHDQFSSINGHRVYQVLKDLHTLEQGDKSVEIYYHKLKNLWDEYAALESVNGCKCENRKIQEEKEQRKKLLQFLMGLNDSYSSARGQILMMSPLPSLSQAFSLVKQDEKQKQGTYNPHTFVANVKSNPVSTSQGGSQSGKSSGPANQNNRSSLKCSHCNKEGHTREQCYKLIGYPDKKKGKPKNATSGFRTLPQQNFAASQTSQTTPVIAAHVANQSTTDIPSLEQLQSQVSHMNNLMLLMMNQKGSHNSPEDHMISMAGMAYSFHTTSQVEMSHLWIIDTGASHHMCCHLESLTNIKSLQEPFLVALPNKHIISVVKTGDVVLSPSITLKNVLFIPEFNCNLLSVSQLTQHNNCVVTFSAHSCVFQDQMHQKVLAIGKAHHDLYYFNATHLGPSSSQHPSSVQKSAAANTVNTSIDLYKLWHLRLGHTSDLVMKHIPVLKTVSSNCNRDCPACPLAKQCKLTFPNHSNSHASAKFDLIHMDVWGPYSVATNQGFTYFLTIVDDFSRATWVFLMTHKHQVFTIFQKFMAYINTQFDSSVKTIRTDNGTEFINKPFHDFLANLGIVHETSCPYTPQQNGRVERKHRHLLEMSRALRFQSGLPLKYWGDCVLTAAYLINLLPTPVLNHKTPFHMLYNKAPDYTDLRAFGCLCYASVHSSDKFAPRAIKSVFLGYPFHQKGYKLLNLETHAVFVSRHVQFQEHIFPYHKKSVNQPVTVSFMDWYCPTSTSVFYNSSGHNDSHADSENREPVFQTGDGGPSPQISPIRECSPIIEDGSLINSELSQPPMENQSVVNTRPTQVSQSSQPVRHSTRPSNRPSWWSDYQVHTKPSKAHVCQFLSQLPQNVSPQVNSAVIAEPAHFYQAVHNSQWVEAMQKELSALEKNNTWKLVPLPPEKKSYRVQMGV